MINKNNNIRYANVNLKDIIEATNEYKACMTTADETEMLNFADIYFDKYFLIKNIGGKAAVMYNYIKIKEIRDELGNVSFREELKTDLFKYSDFKQSCIKDTFEISVSTKYGNEVKKINYADFWLETKSLACKQYERTVFEPAPSFNDPNVFNLWTGYVEPKQGNIRPFLRHISLLIDGSKEEKRHLIKLIGWTVKYPEKLPGVTTVLVGKQGGGKTTISETVRAMCPNHSNVVSDLEMDLLGQFNEEFMNTKYFLHEESSFAGNKKTASALKHMITGETRKTGIKFLNSVKTDNIGFHIFTSNSDNPINVEENDRRNNVFKCSDKLIGNREYFNEFYAWLNGEGKHALVHYFQNLDYKDFDRRSIVKTKAHDSVKANNLKPVQKFIYDILNDEIEFEKMEVIPEARQQQELKYKAWITDDMKINRTKAYDRFLEFSKSLGITLLDYPQSKFTNILSEMFNFPEGFKDNWKNSDGRYYKIPPFSKAKEMFADSIGGTVEGLFGRDVTPFD